MDVFGTHKVPSLKVNDVGDLFTVYCVNDIVYNCSISDNLINLTFLVTTLMNVPLPHEEYDITLALSNAFSFVIIGNELIIYFKEVKDRNLLSYCTIIENRNLLILKKQ